MTSIWEERPNKLAESLETPALLFEEGKLKAACGLVKTIREVASCDILFACKALDFMPVLRAMQTGVDGFAVSSAFEARLAASVATEQQHIQLTSPGLSKRECEDAASNCTAVCFNSVEQLRHLLPVLPTTCDAGIRVNPELSFVRDARYDPCRKASKLGVPVSQLATEIQVKPDLLCGIKGLLIHSNYGSNSFCPLFETVEQVVESLGDALGEFEWINLGGGYWLDADVEPLQRASELLRNKYGLSVLIEPGSGIVAKAGVIVSSVVDQFVRDGVTVCVLDTTINHMPEVFEYQFEPDVAGHRDGAPHSYLLAGASCLAGDVFGEYSFDDQLEVGSRVVFEEMGAYTFVKSHMFNGINLPTVYMLTEAGDLELVRRFGYDDYLARVGGQRHAPSRD